LAITVGVPKALAYYDNHDLWETFFKELGCEVIYSPDTNKDLLEAGKKYVIDESCLPMKIYMGHLEYLQGKCDYILIPHLQVINKKEETCTNFLAIYDLARNLFEGKIITYHVNVNNNETEEKAFLKMASDFDFSKEDIRRAYYSAKRKMMHKRFKEIKDNLNLLDSDKIKILLVSHPYNTYDKFIGEPIINYLNKNNITIIHAHLNNCKTDKYKEYSKTLYWTYSKNLVNGLAMYEGYVDGIIFLTTFPCGPDSLVNELCLTKVDKPAIQLVIDELNSGIGLETRLESFIDILERKRVRF